MGEPKRPGQGRSAVPEFNQTEFALHHGSNAGRLIDDLGTGDNTAEETPAAMQRLIGMLSSVRGEAGGDATDVTPIQRNLFARLMATLEEHRDKYAVGIQNNSTPIIGDQDAEIFGDGAADDARIKKIAMQQRVATLRERAIAARDERIRAQKLEQWPAGIEAAAAGAQTARVQSRVCKHSYDASQYRRRQNVDRRGD